MPPSAPLDLAPLGLPLDPAAWKLGGGAAEVGLRGQAGGGATADAGLAVKHHLGILRRPRKAKTLLKLLLGQEEGVGRTGNGHVERGRDAACLGELGWLAHVDDD